MRPLELRHRTWLALLVGLTGVVSGLVLPFAPVVTQTTSLVWPAPGQPTVSTTALVVPYRPQQLTVSLPCSALRGPGTVLDTGGLSVTGDNDGAKLVLDGRDVQLPVPDPTAADCRARIEAADAGTSVIQADGRVTYLAGQPAPRVFGMRTDLDPAAAAGLSVSAVITGPFATTPTTLKTVLVAVQVLSAVAALVLLGTIRLPRFRRPRWHRLWLIDLAVIATFCAWAVIGPLAVDDGWATMIARNVAATGDPGNYYRWWNAAEVPFAFSQHLLAPLTEISIAPLWMRVPSTVLAVATWFVLTRGVLGAALPALATTARMRLLAALCLLAAWLPFDLGTRPEAFVAVGLTTALAIAWRARGPAALGGLALVCALTVPVSPTGVLVVAPIVVFAGRLRAAARRGARSWRNRVAVAALVCGVGAVALTVIFADQTWDALVTATDWHRTFGPSLPWYDEPTRYRYLLQHDQQGSFAKRTPILVVAALVPLVVVLTLRGRERADAAARRLALVVVLMLVLFATGPSKWSYHLGAGAGVVAAFLTVTVVALARRARTADRRQAGVAVAGAALLAGAVALAFAGPNAWWLPALYDVPWAWAPIRPAGVPLDSPLLWAAVLAAGTLTALWSVRRRATTVVALTPVVLTLVAFGTMLAVLIGSFAAAPLRRSAGSLAVANLHRIASTRVCGVADDIEVLPDGDVLTATEPSRGSASFAVGAGYAPGAPPPDGPGSRDVWGSWTTGPQATGALVTPWFALPALSSNGVVALSVSGRTTDGNELALEFGRSSETGARTLGTRTPVDRPAVDEEPSHPLWRSIGVDAADVPPSADLVRIRAVDGRTDEQGWLAFTGPRLRSTVPLTAFLAANGPVLISWPQSFLFPCVHNIAAVSGGLAQTPRTVVESPRPWFLDDRDPAIGGTFAGITVFPTLAEIPSRVIGHPEIDWGSIRVTDAIARDAYARTTTRSTQGGFGHRGRPAER
ncbi:arabinosyltransferase domain-containing protein [Mycolicibacterium rufum]|uniref:Arabinosyltransferase domain-containing protein n=2 Tax=Mycolicibacterium rufum TaxID=318424 RepID=A0ABY3UG96_9MYCO|nr:arabinosyltransferase domain-containing protein [Mycolicibacterium rufum]ULP37542.1 arabinosyltransferase domain-containing protein [Mycolicibacterium rufum]